jgi:hypothetical protein
LVEYTERGSNGRRGGAQSREGGTQGQMALEKCIEG